jgi:hypothetical protein
MATNATRPGFLLPLIATIALGALTIFEFADATDRMKTVNDSGAGSGHLAIGLYIVAGGIVIALITSVAGSHGRSIPA